MTTRRSQTNRPAAEAGQAVIEYGLVVALVSLVIVGLFVGIATGAMTAITDVITAGLP